MATAPSAARRCWWCGDDADYIAYHDHEWGRPVVDDRRLFEKLCLEGFQAGLSWLTILRKREHFRRAFAGFDIDAVAAFGEADVRRLLADPGIVRHRGKIEAAIGNAARARELIAEAGSLAAFVWRYEPAPATRPRRMTEAVLRALTTAPEAHAMSPASKLCDLHALAEQLQLAAPAVGRLLDHAGVLPVAERDGAMLYDRLSLARLRHEINRLPSSRPADALPRIRSAGRTPLTIDEGVALLTQHPEVLSERNAFQALASRADNKRIPSFWMSKGAPRLGWCWEGNPHSWLGAASAAQRLVP